MAAKIRYLANPQSTTGDSIAIEIPACEPGDHLYVGVVTYAPFAETLAACVDFPTPDGWDEPLTIPISESATVVGRFSVFCRVVPPEGLSGDFTVTVPTSATQKFTFSVGASIMDVGGTPGIDIFFSGPHNTDDAPTSAIPVHQDDTVVVQLGASVGQFPSFALPPPYIVGAPQRTNLLYGGEVRLAITAPLDADVAALGTSIEAPQLLTGGTGWYVLGGIALIPTTGTVGLPSTAEFRRLQLGCADDYRVFITSSDYQTVIDGVGWSDIEWNLALDESATAEVTVPSRFGGVKCCAHLGGLRPWRYGLRIERNDVEVWSGPVTSINRVSNGVRVGASDVMARFQKRLTTRDTDLHFSNADAGVAFAAVVLAAQIAGEQWSLEPPEVTVGKPLTRTVQVADFEMAFDVIQDLADSSIDFWVRKNVLYVFSPGVGWMYWDGIHTVLLEGPYNAGKELVYGTFTERNFVEFPMWSLNGWAQGNEIWIPGADTGEDGSRRLWTASDPGSIPYDGVLDFVETGTLYRPEDEDSITDDMMQHFADTALAQRAQAPAIVEGVALADNAPVDVENLRPGSLWQLDIFDDCYGQLLQTTRLKRVKVSASKSQEGQVTERVEPTLFPVGFTNEEA
jgi:hypothetical protein